MKTIILSIVLLFFISCENPIEEPDYLQSFIYGTITVSDTGEPSDSVGISIWNIKVRGFNDVRHKKIGGAFSYELVSIN